MARSEFEQVKMSQGFEILAAGDRIETAQTIRFVGVMRYVLSLVQWI